MPNCDPQDGVFDPIPTLMMDSYSLTLTLVLLIKSISHIRLCLVAHTVILITTLRIYHKCEGNIEKSIPRITVWHHEAC